MTQFRPFRGLSFNEPGSGPEDGVMDVSSVLGVDSTSEFAAERLVREPELVYQWLDTERLTEDADPSLYMYRAGWRGLDGNSTQAAGVFGLGPTLGAEVLVNPTLIVIPDLEFDLLLTPIDMPLVTATIGNGEGAEVHFRLWPLRQAGVIQTISEAVLRHGVTSGGLIAASTTNLVPPPGLIIARELE